MSMPWSKELIDMRYKNLVFFSSQLKAGKGLSVVSAFIKGDPVAPGDRKRADEVSNSILLQTCRFANALIKT